MRCLVLHCREFSYRLMQATSAAAPDEMLRGAAHNNCLTVFVAAEDGDGDHEVGACAKEIRKRLRKTGAVSVVVNPFAHLTTNGAAHHAARMACAKLQQRLAATANAPVVFTSFGWVKEFRCDVVGDGWAQGWIEYRPVKT